MKTTCYICIISASLLSATFVNSQPVSSCTNADFEFNSFVNWVGSTGSCCPVNTTVNGIVNGRHTIMSGTGFDPLSNGLIPLVPPGAGQYTARLGNKNTGAQAEKLSYTFPVTMNTALFIYRYAVVLQDPNHTAANQPRFSIRVFDQNNLPVTCGTYDVVASANIPGFVSIGDLRIKTWTTVGIELTSYIGQNITIEFTTADCGLGAHFGYAYMDAYCSPFQISSDFCPGSSYTTINAPVGFSSYQWNTGDTTSTIMVQNPVVGTSYSCTMTSVTGCQVTLNTVLTPTNINAGFISTVACANEARFVDTSQVITGTPIVQWHWDFGDGASSNVQHPVHNYPAPGNYNVTLIVYNSGCSDTLTKTVTILPVPISDFTYVPQCPATPVNFTDASVYANGPITEWKWSFGDGSAIDTRQNPDHIFASVGPYQVTLVVTAANGCTDTIIKPVLPQLAPVASFSYISRCDNTVIDFNETAIYSCGPVTGYIWNFGDGTPLSTEQNPVHLYSAAGTYNVQLITIGLNGTRDTLIMQVMIPFSPNADFTAAGACFHTPSFFTDLSTVPQGNINNWFWEFGDGVTVTGNGSVTHVYNEPGVYNARLIAESNDHCRDTVNKDVFVWELPVSSFVSDITSGCEPLEVHFYPTSTASDGTLSGFYWDFGNMMQDSAIIGNTIYPAGTYSITLVSSTSLGCTDSFTAENLITAFPLPEPDFTFTPNYISVFMPEVYFKDISNDAISWLWDFGDNSISSQQHPFHHYGAAGKYPVTLQVVSNLGCVGLVEKIIDVIQEHTLYIPSAFTPDGDGINDLFIGIGEGIISFQISIFNRWGELVWSGDRLQTAWDGTHNNQPVQAGVYTYLAKVASVDNRNYQVKGTVALIK